MQLTRLAEGKDLDFTSTGEISGISLTVVFTSDYGEVRLLDGARSEVGHWTSGDGDWVVNVLPGLYKIETLDGEKHRLLDIAGGENVHERF